MMGFGDNLCGSMLAVFVASGEVLRNHILHILPVKCSQENKLKRTRKTDFCPLLNSRSMTGIPVYKPHSPTNQLHVVEPAWVKRLSGTLKLRVQILPKANFLQKLLPWDLHCVVLRFGFASQCYVHD